MKRYLWVIVLAGCTAVHSDQTAEQLQQQWEQTYMVGNAKKLANMYVENAEVVDTEVIQGRAEIERTLEDHFDRYRVLFEEDIVEVQQNGQVVYTTRFERRLTQKNDNGKVFDAGSREITYVETPEGWRIQREVWQ